MPSFCSYPLGNLVLYVHIYAYSAEAAQGKPINKMDEEAKDENLSDSSPDVPLPLRQQRESFLI